MLREVFRETTATMARRAASGDGMTGIPTGLRELDAILRGLQPSELTVLASRPSFGKTSLAVTIALRAAQHGYPVLYFSLEESRFQLARRILSNATGIDRGLLDRSEHAAQLAVASAELASVLLTIEDDPCPSHSRIVNSCNRWRSGPGAPGRRALGLVIVDDLLSVGAAALRRRPADAIGESTAVLKELAAELGCAVLALTKLGRQIEERREKRPMLADACEAGIGDYADTVMALYRDEVYNDCAHAGPHGEVECRVLRHRSGSIGTVYLSLARSCGRFDDHERPPGEF